MSVLQASSSVVADTLTAFQQPATVGIANAIVNTASVAISVNTTIAPTTDDFPSEWLWVKPFVDWLKVPTNRANYVVGPLMLLIFVGSGVAYVVGHLLSYCNFKLKIKRNEKLGLPPPKKKKKKKKLNFIQRMKQKKKEEEEKLLQEEEKKKADEIRRLALKARRLEANKTKCMTESEQKAILEKYYASIELPYDYKERRNSWSGPLARYIHVDIQALKEPIKPKPPRKKKAPPPPPPKTPTPEPLTEEEQERLERRVKKIKKRIKREYMRRMEEGLPMATQAELDAMGLTLPPEYIFIMKQRENAAANNGNEEDEKGEKEAHNVENAVQKSTLSAGTTFNGLQRRLSPRLLSPIKRRVEKQKVPFANIATIWPDDKPDSEKTKQQKMKDLKERARLMRLKRQNKAEGESNNDKTSKQVSFADEKNTDSGDFKVNAMGQMPALGLPGSPDIPDMVEASMK